MNIPKRTDGTWFAGKPMSTSGSSVKELKGVIGIGNGACHIAYVSITGCVPAAEAEANAEFIVRAVNAHEALLASCKRDLASMRRNGADDPETRAAIALAEGPGEPCAANRQPQLLEAILVIKELAKYEGPFSADITRICETAIAKANETVPASAFPKYFPPWYVQHRDLVDVIRDRNNHLIAHCQPEHSGLFAAAPELLAACKELKDCLFRWMEIAEENDKRDYDDEAVAKATAAIAKAEGN